MLKTAWWLISIGLAALLFLIPGCNAFFDRIVEDNSSKTEFFSARACYWLIITGLLLIVVAAVGLEIERVVAILKGH
jgi:hypothetical protein